MMARRAQGVQAGRQNWAWRKIPPLVWPTLACAASLLIIGFGNWGPGVRIGTTRSKLSIEIPLSHRSAISSWETFFVCYSLADHRIMRPTLEAWLRTHGSLDFPRDGRVDVELLAEEARGLPSEDVQALMDRIRSNASGYSRQCNRS